MKRLGLFLEAFTSRYEWPVTVEPLLCVRAVAGRDEKYRRGLVLNFRG